jgi:hypothetical protein
MKIKVFFGDMRLEKYTYDDRKGGQVPCAAHALCASVRSSQTPPQRYPIKTLAVLIESVSDYGVPENACIFGE